MPTWSNMDRLCPNVPVGSLETMERRTLGQGLEVSAVGLGCMGMSEFYGARDEEEALATIRKALDIGVTFLDTADMYGPFTNEKLIARAIVGRRHEVQLATKLATCAARTASGWGSEEMRTTSGRRARRRSSAWASITSTSTT